MLFDKLLLRRHKREISQSLLLRVWLDDLRETDIDIRGDVSDSHERERDDTFGMHVENARDGERAPVDTYKDAF